MDHFFSSIVFIFVLVTIHIYYGVQQIKIYKTFKPLSNGLLILWVLISGMIFRYSFWPHTLSLMILISCVLAFYQDWTTQYFSLRWLCLLLIAILFIPYCPVEFCSRLMACAYAGMMGIAVYFHWFRFGGLDLYNCDWWGVRLLAIAPFINHIQYNGVTRCNMHP